MSTCVQSSRPPTLYVDPSELSLGEWPAWCYDMSAWDGSLCVLQILLVGTDNNWLGYVDQGDDTINAGYIESGVP